MRRSWFLIALLAIVLYGSAQQAQAQFGGYGAAAWTPSPQASYGPNGSVTGVLYPNGVYIGSGGYVPPGPIYGYGNMGYGGYGRPMPLGQALLTSAAIVAISNNNRGYYGGGYGYQPYGARGFRGGYHHHR